MNKKILILGPALLSLAGCASKMDMSPDDLRPCSPPAMQHVQVTLIKVNNDKAQPPSVVPPFVCVLSGGTVTFNVSQAAANDNVVTVPADPNNSWMFGVKPSNGNSFTIQADAGQGDYKYLVFWTGKLGLDPIVGVR